MANHQQVLAGGLKPPSSVEQRCPVGADASHSLWLILSIRTCSSGSLRRRNTIANRAKGGTSLREGGPECRTGMQGLYWKHA